MDFPLSSTVSLNLDPSIIPKVNANILTKVQTSQVELVSETPLPRAVQKEPDHGLHSFLATSKKGEMVDEN